MDLVAKVVDELDYGDIIESGPKEGEQGVGDKGSSSGQGDGAAQLEGKDCSSHQALGSRVATVEFLKSEGVGSNNPCCHYSFPDI